MTPGAQQRTLSALDASLVRDGIARAAKLNAAGEHEAAAAAARQALARDPHNPDATYEIAAAAHLAGRYEDAIATLGLALQFRPRWKDAYAGLSRAHRAAGRLPEALEAIDTALALDHKDTAVIAERASLLTALGHGHEAMGAYRAILRVDPDHAGATIALAALAAAIVEPMTPEYVAHHFDHYAPTFEDHLTKSLGYIAPETMASLLPSGQLGTVLDLGCGTGLVAAALAGRYVAIDGVDLSPRMIELSRGKGLYRALHVGEAVAYLASTGRRYDLITAAEVFNYMGPLEPIFEMAGKRLRPGGRFAFSTEAETETAGDYVLQPTGRYTQSPAYIERLAAVSGYRLETAKPGTLRYQAGEPVAGYFHVLVKQ